MIQQKIFAIIVSLSIFNVNIIHAMAVRINQPQSVTNNSDSTSFSDTSEGKITEVNPTKPSWMKRQFSRIGGVAGQVGNAFGAATVRASTTAEKICDLVKKIIPIIAAICHVGQFKFCAATGMSPSEEPTLYETDYAKLDPLD